MASVKLVNGNPHHHHHHPHPHSLYSHPHHPFLHHHALVTPPSAAAPGYSMTLDYSLPNRSRLGDADPSDLTTASTTNSIGGHASDSSHSRPNSHQSQHSDSNNMSSSSPPPRPLSAASPSGSDNPEPQGITETPTKKNKRKLSEPRKRSDLGGGGTTNKIDSSRDAYTSGSDSDEEEISPTDIKIPKIVPALQNRVFVPSENNSNSARKSPPLKSSSNKLHSNSSLHRKRPSPPPSSSPSSSNPFRPSSLWNSHPHFLHHPSSSASPSISSSPPSSRASPSSTSKQSENNNSENNKHPSSSTTSSSALPNGIPPSFLHPYLSTVPPAAAAAFGFVPALYFGGQNYTPSALPASFPPIPLHLQQSYLAAATAAAAAAQQQSTGSKTAAASPPTSSSLSASTSATSSSTSSSSTAQSAEKRESSPFCKPRDSPSHPVILQPPQIPSNPSSSHKTSGGSSSSLHSRIPQPSSSLSSTSSSSLSSSQQQQSSSFFRDNQNDEDDDDDDAGSSFQPNSPEDLSMGGKLSRKHRKNYKNMTRERRVEANARERTRVHTISAAFDALRKAVPSYSYNQKLSKLAILRIACSYIMSLARLADLDYTSPSEHIGRPLSFAECVDMCTNTIQTEGRARRRH